MNFNYILDGKWRFCDITLQIITQHIYDSWLAILKPLCKEIKPLKIVAKIVKFYAKNC